MEKLKIKWVKDKHEFWYTGTVSFKNDKLYDYFIYKDDDPYELGYSIHVNEECLSWENKLIEAKNFCKNHMLQIQGLA